MIGSLGYCSNRKRGLVNVTNQPTPSLLDKDKSESVAAAHPVTGSRLSRVSKDSCSHSHIVGKRDHSPFLWGHIQFHDALEARAVRLFFVGRSILGYHRPRPQAQHRCGHPVIERLLESPAVAGQRPVEGRFGVEPPLGDHRL